MLTLTTRRPVTTTARHATGRAWSTSPVKELAAALGATSPWGRHRAGPAAFDVSLLSDGDHPMQTQLRGSTTVWQAVRQAERDAFVALLDAEGDER